MAIVASSKVTNCLLQAALVGLVLCTPTQSNAVEAQTAGTSKASSGLPRVYQQWLDEDVRWIITPDERATFLRLPTNEERDHFVEQFWLSRDPTPNTPENEYEEEHYRRIAYANVHFPWQAVLG
jgi:hypothetical protein